MGTSIGFSGLYLHKARQKVPMITLEGNPFVAHIAQQHFKQLNAEVIQIKVGDFKDTLSEALERLQTVGLAFIDGNHTYEATKDYFEKMYNDENEFNIAPPLNSANASIIGFNYNEYPEFSQNKDVYGTCGSLRNSDIYLKKTAKAGLSMAHAELALMYSKKNKKLFSKHYKEAMKQDKKIIDKLELTSSARDGLISTIEKYREVLRRIYKGKK
jgi:hypothetical protein